VESHVLQDWKTITNLHQYIPLQLTGSGSLYFLAETVAETFG